MAFAAGVAFKLILGSIWKPWISIFFLKKKIFQGGRGYGTGEGGGKVERG